MERQKDIRGKLDFSLLCMETYSIQAMFDILEADIVVLQECKIQRKDLRDDMVLVPGWDVYFSLPKHKKGGILEPASIRKSINALQDTPALQYTPATRHALQFARKRGSQGY